MNFKTNKTNLVVALGTAFLAGLIPAARADLSLGGGVGLPLNPTAQLPPPGSVQLQLNGYDLGTINGFGSFKHYGLHAVGRVGERLEVGAGIEKSGDYFDAGGLLGIGPFGFSGEVGQSLALANVEKLGFAIHAKYLLSRSAAPQSVRLAAGVGYSGALLDNTYAYLVASKGLSARRRGRAPLTGHWGCASTAFRCLLFPAPAWELQPRPRFTAARKCL